MSTVIDREEWLANRRRYLGASEVAAVLGQSPWAGPLDVYASKISGQGIPESRAMQRGHAMEPLIADWYAEETGREIEDVGATVIQVHPSIPFLSATLDRLIPVAAEHSGSGPLEIKSVGGRASRADWEIDPPLNYQIQLQIQMAVTGSSWGALCGGFAASDDLIHRDFDFNAEFFEAAVPILEEFWHRVETKNPPPVGTSPHALESVKRIYSAASADKMIALPSEVSGLVAEWETVKKLKNDASKKADEIEARIRDIMKDAEWGALDDGFFLSLKTTVRKGYIVSDSSFRTLRKVKAVK